MTVLQPLCGDSEGNLPEEYFEELLCNFNDRAIDTRCTLKSNILKLLSDGGEDEGGDAEVSRGRGEEDKLLRPGREDCQAGVPAHGKVPGLSFQPTQF